MAGKQILLLTGEIQSGKTTALLNWIQKRTDVAGILTPVENGRRYFLAYPGRVRFEMEAEASESNILEVGRYRFSATNFERASIFLNEQLKQPHWKYIVVDEIGPLELKNKAGFWTVVNEILQAANISIPVLVVRKNCCDELAALFIENGFTVSITGTEDFESTVK